MDLDEVLIRVQGALITLKRVQGLKKDSNCNTRSENDRNSAFHKAMENVMSSYRDSDDDLRRINLYLILNSDFEFNQKVSEEENFGHIVSTAPTLDKFMLIETISDLDLLKYAGEIIVFGHPIIRREYTDVILKTLQRNKSVKFLPLIECTISALHQKLLNLNLVRESINVSHEANEISYYFKTLISLFNPPHGDSKIGYVVKTLLSLLCSCLDQRRDVSSYEHCNLYKMNLPHTDEMCLAPSVIEVSRSEDISLLVKALKSNINLVDLSTWMKWSECKWETNKPTLESKSMQEMVGELAYLCKQKLEHITEKIPEVGTLSSVLSNMAIKPYTEDDEIENTPDLSTMVSKAKTFTKSESKKKWLSAMLKIPDSLKDLDCYDFIKEYRQLIICQEEIFLLMERTMELTKTIPLSSCSVSTQELKNFKDIYELKVKELLFTVFSQVCVEDQGKLIGLFYEKYGLSKIFITSDFDKMAIEIFNKAVNSDGKKSELISDMCILCLQSPRETVQRLLTLASGCSSQISFVTDVLLVISKICHLIPERECSVEKAAEAKCSERNLSLICWELITLMKSKHWNEVEKSNFIELVIQCHKSSLLNQEEFLGCFYHCITYSLENSSWNIIDLCLETLNDLSSSSSFTMESLEHPAVLLAVFLQVLEKGKQEMRENFSVPAASTCELIISHLPLFLEKITTHKLAKDKEILWLKNRVAHASIFSQYYFNSLWSDMDGEIEVYRCYDSLFMQLFFQTSVLDVQKILDLLNRKPVILRYSLFKVLPSCTTTEWINIAHELKKLIQQTKDDNEQLYLKLFMIFSDILTVMISVTSKKVLEDNMEALYIIELWFKNFARIIKEEFWPCCKYFCQENSFIVFCTIVNLLEIVPTVENIRETCSFLMINILSDIIGSLPSQTPKTHCSTPVLIQYTACVSLISENELRKSLARKLSELIEKNPESFAISN